MAVSSTSGSGNSVLSMDLARFMHAGTFRIVEKFI